MNTIEDLKNGVIGIKFDRDLIKLRLILSTAFPYSDSPVNGFNTYYFVVKQFEGMFGVSNEVPKHIEKWVSESEIDIPIVNDLQKKGVTPLPWDINYEGGLDIYTTHHKKNFNRRIATFRNNSDVIRCIDCVNAFSGIKNPEKWMESVQNVFDIFDNYVQNHPEGVVGESKSNFILNRAKKYDEVLDVLKSIKEMIDEGHNVKDESIIVKALMSVLIRK